MLRTSILKKCYVDHTLAYGDRNLKIVWTILQRKRRKPEDHMVKKVNNRKVHEIYEAGVCYVNNTICVSQILRVGFVYW